MSWPDVPIKDVCLLAVDCVNKTAPVVDYETPYRMLRTTNVRGGFVDADNTRFVNEETFIKWTRRGVPKKGDVILTREAPLGDVGRLTSDNTVFLGQRLFMYRADPEKLNSEYLAYALQSPLVQGRIKSKGFGATVEHARVGDCENLLIPVPDLVTQERIGNILAAYDDLIENNKRRIELLEESARQLYKEWFVRFRFPGHEHVKIIDGVPEGWTSEPLDRVVDVIKHSVDPTQLPASTPYIGLEHMPRRSFTLNVWETSEKVTSTKYKFNQGDILFGKIRPYFHKIGFALTAGITSSDAIVMRPKLERQYFVALCEVTSDQFIALASKTVREGSKMPRADWKVLKQRRILCPSEALLEVFNSQIVGIVDQCKTLSYQNFCLTQARDLLLPKLMNGEIAV